MPNDSRDMLARTSENLRKDIELIERHLNLLNIEEQQNKESNMFYKILSKIKI